MVSRAQNPRGELIQLAAEMRAEGVAVTAVQIRDAAAALDALDPRWPRHGYWALRCALVRRQQDLAAFDAAFRRWSNSRRRPSPRGAANERVVGPERAAGGNSESGPISDADGGRQAEGAADGAQRLGSSAQERLRHLDFSAYGPAELRRLHRAMELLARRLPRRREQRLKRSRMARRVDLRRTVAAATRTEGLPLRRAWRERRRRPFRLVLVLDISRSMDAYARALLSFAHAAVRANRRVEVFTFGTRLTRATSSLAESQPDRALAAVARTVPDWSSGTRIGENLATLNERWGGHGLLSDALVVILSDGCEHGDPTLLAEELAKLRRRAHALVWVNPLAGDVDYAPRAAGMAAALPQLDELLAGHDLTAIETLVEVVCALDGRRTAPRCTASGRTASADDPQGLTL